MLDKFNIIKPSHNLQTTISEEIERETMKVMYEYTHKLERSVELQTYCYYCLKDRPELVETLKKEEWVIVQKIPTIEDRMGKYVLVSDAWWACKECQLGGYKFHD